MIKKNTLVCIPIAILLVILLLNHQPSTVSHQPSTIKILCIGDSITQGGNFNKEYSYRYPLYNLLKSNNYKVNFVGSRQKGLQQEFTWPKDFDTDHEGYYGKNTAYVTNAVLKNLERFEKADLAIINLGTNDKKVVSEQTISKPIKNLILALRVRNPNIKVLIVQIPGWGNLKMHYIIYKLKIEMSNIKSPIETIPLYVGWDPQLDTFDGVHPNLLGQSKIAKVIFEKIKSLFESSNYAR